MDPDVRQATVLLLKAYNGNHSKVAKVLHISKHTVVTVANEESQKAQNDPEETDNPEETDDQGEYPEDKETKQETDKIDALEKENQVLQSELDEGKSEIERLIKNSEKVWHQHQQQQTPASSQKVLAQDILREMLSADKLPPSFLKYVDVNQMSGKNRDREQYIYNVRRDMSENFLQLKNSLPSLESLICEMSNDKSNNEAKQACLSMGSGMEVVVHEIKTLATIPIDHPSLFIIPDEVSVRLLKDTTMLTDKVFPVLLPSIAVARTTGKESKYFANIAASLGNLIRIISGIDVYFAPHLIEYNN